MEIDNLDLCIVHSHQGERISEPLAAVLDPIDAATLHEYVLAANTPVELHCHDYDEYWWFTSGTPIVTLWTEDNGAQEYQERGFACSPLQAGDLVACVRGVAHTLRANHTLVYYQFTSVKRPGARMGHLPVET